MNTTIDVQVSGGVSPIPIKVVIDNINNNEDLSFKRELSFSESYKLAPGEYLITISGMNPEGGETDMEISGEFEKGPMPSHRQSSDEMFYSKFFYIKIATP